MLQDVSPPDSTYLINADDLAICLLNLSQLHQEVPEPRSGNNSIGCKDSHTVELRSWIGLARQMTADDLVFLETPSCSAECQLTISLNVVSSQAVESRSTQYLISLSQLFLLHPWSAVSTQFNQGNVTTRLSIQARTSHCIHSRENRRL